MRRGAAAVASARVKISACLIVCNEEKNLARCLASIAPVVDEIVVVDSGSNDGTVAIAQSFQARVIGQPWLGYVAQKNAALGHAAHPWVLSIDADEELSPELAASIIRLRDGSDEKPGAPNGYQVSRLVFYRQKWIRHGDWYPDRLVRLFRRDAGHFTGGRVHEKLEIAGEHPVLAGDLHHYTYADDDDRAARRATYAALWAQTALEKRRGTWPGIGPYHATVRFVRGYIFKRGFLDGEVGFDIATGNAREVWLKYHLLRRLQAAGGVRE
jgi:glycosyltransferase involved in cell wall biosynthesis